MLRKKAKINENVLRLQKVKRLLKDLRSGDLPVQTEIVRELSGLRNPPIKQIINILSSNTDVQIREAVAYILSFWVPKSNSKRNYGRESLEALLRIFNKPGEANEIRAQALEGFNLHEIPKRSRLWRRIERATLVGLNDESQEVRFWACYAAGQLEMKNALPHLRQLAENDKALARMWYVAEEASDAIKWIHKLPTKHRKPIGSRKNKSFIKYYFEKVLEKRAAKRKKRLV